MNDSIKKLAAAITEAFGWDSLICNKYVIYRRTTVDPAHFLYSNLTGNKRQEAWRLGEKL